MEISIGELQSTVRTTAGPLLHPDVLDRIVEAAVARIRLEQEQERRAAAVRRLLDDGDR